MDLRAEQRKEEMESEKKKLDSIREMIAETTEKISKIESEFRDQKAKHQKTLLNLRNLEENQEFRRNKLDADINQMDQRHVDIVGALDTNKKLKAEMEELENGFPDYDKQIEKLEQEIKEAYLEWENFKENQVMIEVGMDFVQGEDCPALLNPLFRKRWDTIKYRQRELNKELAKIDKEINFLEREITNKQSNLLTLRNEESCLKKKYAEMKMKKVS